MIQNNKTQKQPSTDISYEICSIDSWEFCENCLTSISIPDNITSIGREAFRDNELETVNIAD